MLKNRGFLWISCCLILAVSLAGCAAGASESTQSPAAPIELTQPPAAPVEPNQVPTAPVELKTEVPTLQTEAPAVTEAEVQITAPALDGAALLEARCSKCHSANKPKQAKKSLAQWETTVNRMIGKGAQLTDAEKAALVAYLAETYGP